MFFKGELFIDKINMHKKKHTHLETQKIDIHRKTKGEILMPSLLQ